MRVADVRFVFDENIIGLAKIIADVRDDVTYPGYPGAVKGHVERPRCPIDRGTKDVEWLPRCGARLADHHPRYPAHTSAGGGCRHT